ncbi:MAG: hypothetical protein R6W75_06575 [Smithellaceae bacterium]
MVIRHESSSDFDVTTKGFRNIPQQVHEGVPPEAFFALPFVGNVPKGAVMFHEGFQSIG